MKLIFNNYAHFLNLKAKYGYKIFCCFLNYYFVVHACIELRLICKIPIVAIPELTKTFSDQVTMLFCAGSSIAGGGNVKYVYFNLPELLSIAGSTNSDGCYLLVRTKISNFLYGI